MNATDYHALVFNLSKDALKLRQKQKLIQDEIRKLRIKYLKVCRDLQGVQLEIDTTIMESEEK